MKQKTKNKGKISLLQYKAKKNKKNTTKKKDKIRQHLLKQTSNIKQKLTNQFFFVFNDINSLVYQFIYLFMDLFCFFHSFLHLFIQLIHTHHLLLLYHVVYLLY